jgi:DNA-binding MarR family transcriptional regulator
VTIRRSAEHEVPIIAASPTNTDGESTSTRALALALQNVDAGHRAMRRQFANALGLSASEFRAVMHVGRAVELTPKSLAHELDMTTGAVTAMIDRLEASGLIARRPNPTDRRSLFLHLSPDGLKVLAWVQDDYYATVVEAVRNAVDLSVEDVIGMLEHLSVAIDHAAVAIDASPLD